jgi:hypothetical protein
MELRKNIFVVDFQTAILEKENFETSILTEEQCVLEHIATVASQVLDLELQQPISNSSEETLAHASSRAAC